MHCPSNSPHEGEIIIITDSKLLSILSPSNYSDMAVIIRTESDNLFVPLCCLQQKIFKVEIITTEIKPLSYSNYK